MNNPDNDQLLLEQLVLEAITLYKQLDRQKDQVGIITQWGIGPWLLMKNLGEHEAETVEQIARLQHISSSYCLKMLRQLEKEYLVTKTTKDDVDYYTLSPSGKEARIRLRKSWHAFLGEFEDRFNDAELETSISTLSSLRHMLEERSE